MLKLTSMKRNKNFNKHKNDVNKQRKMIASLIRGLREVLLRKMSTYESKHHILQNLSL